MRSDPAGTVPFWVSAFLDLDADRHAATVAFWAAVTGYAVSPARGAEGEFHTLVPPSGDDHLRVQRVGSGPARVHLDVHVEDPQAAAGAAVDRGAEQVHASDHGYVVMRSPAGVTFCLVAHQASRVAAPAVWPGGARSVVDQVCVDVPPAAYDAEGAFWAATLGRPLRGSSVAPEFASLARPAGQPLRLLLQRLDADQPAGAHLDLACDDRAAEERRHLSLGARLQGRHAAWSVLVDPAGSAYCLTDRDPTSGEVRS